MGIKHIIILTLLIMTYSCSGRDQPEIGAKTKGIITKSGLKFHDLNGNDNLDNYEDWRLTTKERVEDLLQKMTLEEKTGLMMIDTLNSSENGDVPNYGIDYLENQNMRRFIFRNKIVDKIDENAGNYDVSPAETVKFINSIQEIAESSRLGIPVLFKSNPRNHYNTSAKAGIDVGAGALSTWPTPAGLAATRNFKIIETFAETVNKEWKALGIRGMYGYSIDLATEPRWFRIKETFSENAELTADITEILIKKIQGEHLNSNSVMLTLKHFPGGGPQLEGADPHYPFGREQTYPGDNFNYHLEPFKRAINLGVAALMPYYGIPVDQKYEPNNVGMAFSKGIISDLLRDELDFKGVVNSDTGIIGVRGWGLEDKNLSEQLLISLNAGVDLFSGFNRNSTLTNLVLRGNVSENRIDTSVKRLLTILFDLGLFENPYTKNEFKRVNQDIADLAQRESIVLLQNTNSVLPISKDKKVYMYGFDSEKGNVEQPENADYSIVRVKINNDPVSRYLPFGGAPPNELSNISLTEISKSVSWNMEPSLHKLQEIINKTPKGKTIVSIYFSQPFVLDKESEIFNAGALLATFGVEDNALLDVIYGDYKPKGKLPFSLAHNTKAIRDNYSDTPGYKKEETLYPYGYGLEY